MSNAKQQAKNKLNEVAKNLNISNQELIDFIKDKLGVVKKPTANITNDEMNYILEHFTQNNQVDSFDGYFATINAPKPVKKEAPKAESKPAPKKKQPKTEEKPAEEKPAEEKPVEEKPAEEKPAETPEEK